MTKVFLSSFHKETHHTEFNRREFSSFTEALKFVHGRIFEGKAATNEHMCSYWTAQCSIDDEGLPMMYVYKSDKHEYTYHIETAKRALSAAKEEIWEGNIGEQELNRIANATKK